MPAGWLNIEAAGDNVFGGEESAFSKLGLSRTTRLYGFFGCLGGGFILSILGAVLLFLPGGLLPFIVLYSVGIIVSLVGTGFLIGFQKQLTTMFKPVRVVATIILIGSIAATWITVFLVGSAVICLIMVIIMYLAYLWYSLSYIPYARTLIKSFIPGMGS